MARTGRVNVKRWLQWTLAAAGITALFWVTGLLASSLTALEVLSTSVHGLSLADYWPTRVLALAPLSPRILVEASRDNTVKPLPSASASPTGGPTPSPTGNPTGPTPSGLPTLPIPTPTLPIPPPTVPIPTPTPSLPTPPPLPSLP